MQEIATQVVFRDEDAFIKRTQDCTPVAERAKEMHRAGMHGSNEVKLAATIPNILIEQYCLRLQTDGADGMRHKRSTPPQTRRLLPYLGRRAPICCARQLCGLSIYASRACGELIIDAARVEVQFAAVVKGATDVPFIESQDPEHPSNKPSRPALHAVDPMTRTAQLLTTGPAPAHPWRESGKRREAG